MGSERDSRALLVSVLLAVIVLSLFVISTVAVLLVNRNNVAETGPAASAVAIVSGTETAPTSTSPPAATAVTPSTATVAANAATPAGETVTGTTATTPGVPAEATLTPPTTPAAGSTASAASATQSTAAGTRIAWPAQLPAGMALAAADSWPFRTLAAGQENEPFLVFRDEARSLVVRNRRNAPRPVPRSATTEQLTVAGNSAQLVQYLDDGFTLYVPLGGDTIQISGQGLSDDDVRTVAESLQPLSDDDLRARLQQEAAGVVAPITQLWPAYLPQGFALAPAETIVNVGPGTAASAEGYRVSFAGASGRLQIGGGNEQPPTGTGNEEQITQGALSGRLRSSGQTHLLVIDRLAGDNSPALVFPEPTQAGQLRLPLVQRGPVFISAENMIRAEFERVVRDLVSLRSDDFAARARGQSSGELVYLWPDRLPDGYSLDPATARVTGDDWVLQGGRAYYEIIASGPAQGAVTIKGGVEVTGAPFVVPEGPGVQRQTAQIRGRVASGARTPDGAVLTWAEHNSLYSITSPTLQIDQLVTIAEGLQVVSEEDFFRRLQ